MTEIRTPKALRPYIFHGVDIEWYDDEDNAIGECPFCGKDNRFGINKETGQYQCFVCGAIGNVYTFLQWLWKESLKETRDYEDLRVDRSLLFASTLKKWGVCQSLLLDEWLVPAFNENKKLTQIYKYARMENGMRLLATPTLNHQLFGAQLFNYKKPSVYICEGPWDAMSLWEVMQNSSHNQTANVIAVPGCNVWKDRWNSLVVGKTVSILFDNDHPRKHPKSNNIIAPTGYVSMQRTGQIISKAANNVFGLEWGEDGYNPDLASGYDVRDYLLDTPGIEATTDKLSDRLRALQALLGDLVPLNSEAVRSHSTDSTDHTTHNGGNTSSDGGDNCIQKECTSYKQLSVAWRKALKWTEGLDRALVVMLASVSSTKAVGDQLWIKIIGPAACGKSTLCEALSVNDQYVLAKSTIRGFHSGFRMDGGDKEQDNSLIAMVKDKTLITKDGDTLLQSPNLQQILSEARDVYDRTSRTHYRNAMSKNYDGINMTWLLCGTSSLRSIDNSELGERFLDCVIMEGIDEDLEDEILRRVVNKAERNVGQAITDNAESQHDPALMEAMALTGGYVSYLRENAAIGLAEVCMSEESKQQCLNLGKFVAYMRARPSIHQEENAERELASRLVSQHVRLAKCLAFVLNENEASDKVMHRVKKVAMDTSRGRTLEISKALLTEESMPPNAIALKVQIFEPEVKRLLRFLRRIGVTKTTSKVSSNGVRSSVKWCLTSKFRRLMNKVLVQ